MPKPYSKLLNGSIIEYGQYLGGDSRGSYKAKKASWGRPYPVLSNRSGSFETAHSRFTREQISHTGVILAKQLGGWDLAGVVTSCQWVDRCASLHPSIDTANGKLGEKVKDMYLNSPVFLAEANKTIDLFADTAGRLSRGYRAFRKGDLKSLSRELKINEPKQLAKSWLSYRYGWTPLMSDLDGAVRALADQVYLGYVHNARATVKFSVSTNGVSDGVPWTAISTGRVTAVLWYRHKSGTQASRYGFTNPALVAWELVPLSFVADWFVPIGNFLEHLDAFENVSVLASMKIVRYKDTTIHDLTKPKTVGNYRGYGYNTIYRNGMDRVVGIDGANVCTFPIPPGFSLNLTVKRIYDSLALLTVAFGGSLTSRDSLRPPTRPIRPKQRFGPKMVRW